MRADAVRRLVLAALVAPRPDRPRRLRRRRRAGTADGPVTLRLGHFPNLTHATADRRRREGHLRAGARRQRQAGDQDVQRRPGRGRGAVLRRHRRHLHRPEPGHQRVRQVKGARRSGSSPAPRPAVSSFVVKPGITRPEDLKGKKIATPQLGNTQDVALRYWLKQKGLKTTKEGGGDVSIMPQDNATRSTRSSPARSTAPGCPSRSRRGWSAAGGKVLVDERDLWPDGKFVITHLLVQPDVPGQAHRTWSRA